MTIETLITMLSIENLNSWQSLLPLEWSFFSTVNFEINSSWWDQLSILYFCHIGFCSVSRSLKAILLDFTFYFFLFSIWVDEIDFICLIRASVLHLKVWMWSFNPLILSHFTLFLFFHFFNLSWWDRLSILYLCHLGFCFASRCPNVIIWDLVLLQFCISKSECDPLILWSFHILIPT